MRISVTRDLLTQTTDMTLDLAFLPVLFLLYVINASRSRSHLCGSWTLQKQNKCSICSLEDIMDLPFNESRMASWLVSLLKPNNYSHFPSFFYWPDLDEALDLDIRVTTRSMWIITVRETKRSGGKRFFFFFFKRSVLADEMVSLHKTKDPLGNVGCEAHMGKQAADELLTQASHNGLRERGRETEREIKNACNEM